MLKGMIATTDTPAKQEHAARITKILLSAAHKEGLINRVPEFYKKHRVKRAVPVVSIPDLDRMINCASQSARPALALAAFCGLRKSEIMALRMRHFDCTARTVLVEGSRDRHFSPDNPRDEIKSTKTGEVAYIPIPQVAWKYIEPVLKSDPEQMLYETYRNDIGERLNTACRKAYLPKLRFHDLRHICGSHLMMNSGIQVAQAILRHREIGTTVDTYGHMSSEYLQTQVNATFGSELQALAQEMTEHPDKKVSQFARMVLQRFKL